MTVVQQAKTNTMALVGFILSFFLGFVGSILCFVGLEEIKRTGDQGRELAIAGIIIGLAPLVLSLVLLIVFFIFFVFYLIIAFFFAIGYAGAMI